MPKQLQPQNPSYRLFPPSTPLKERIFNRTIPDSKTGCWLWTACLDSKGYGHLGHNGHDLAAHRVAYEEFVGPIPQNLCVLHKCDTPRCCNPAHLFLGTQDDNMKDAARKCRKGNKLCASQVVEILSDTRVHQVIANDYGVSGVLISAIKRRVIWKGVHG
jgi:hypothetical protein